MSPRYVELYMCVEDQIAILNLIKEAYEEAISSNHSGSWGMTDMVVNDCRPST